MEKATESLAELIRQHFNLSQGASEIVVSVLLFALVIVIGGIGYFAYKRILTSLVETTKTKLDDKLLRTMKVPIFLFTILSGVYFSLNTISFLQPYSEMLRVIFTVAEILVVTLVMIRISNVLTNWYAMKGTKKVSKNLLSILKKLTQIIVYVFAVLAILVVFKIDLSGVVVGLGVGGIAIALAVQNVLGDVFAAFSIYFDRPFDLGDFIVIGDYMGTVKKIGIKSTRVQLLQGEELVISNKDLITAKVRNFGKLKKRRITFTINVSVATSLKKLKKIPIIIRKIIDGRELVKFERVHFTEFGEFSFNFLAVYYMETDDYEKYMNTQQEINYAIIEAFEKENIKMPFPTQTIFLNKTSAEKSSQKV